MKRFLIIFLVFAALLLTGCARYVTDKTILDSSGNPIAPYTKEIEFTFTFSGQPALDSNFRYYLIVSTSENMRVAPILQNTYFVAPGEGYDLQKVNNYYFAGDQTKTIQDVYNDYFVSWNSFLVYDATNVIRVTDGQFRSSTANYTAYVLSGAGNIGSANQLKFKMPAVYNDFYFQFLAVDGSKMLRDSLGRNEHVVFSNGYVMPPIVLGSSGGIDAGLDLVSYNYRTYEY